MNSSIEASTAQWLHSTVVIAVKTLLIAVIWTGSATAQGIKWGPDLPVSPPCSDCTNEYADLAVHSSGNAIAIWIQDSRVPGIAVARFDAKAGTWSPAKTLYKPDHPAKDQNLHRPKVVMDKNGNALAVWAESGSNAIYSARYRASNASWTDPKVIHIGKKIGNPQVILASDPKGNAILQWAENQQGAPIFVKHFNASNGVWGAAITLASTGQQFSDMAVDESGNAISIWIRSSDHDVLFSGYKASTGHWSAPAVIGKATQGSDVQIALNRSGDGAALWAMNASAKAPFGFLAVAHFSSRANAWTTPKQIQADAGVIGTPRIAIDPSGNVFVVWGQGANYAAPHKAMAARYDKGKDQWTTPKILSSGTQYNLFFRLATDSAGNAIAIWSQSTRPIGTGPRYFKKAASLYNARAGTWSAISLSQKEVIEAFAWSVDFDSNEHAMALFQQASDKRPKESVLFNIQTNGLTFSR
jgi:hypothetical protein